MPVLEMILNGEQVSLKVDGLRSLDDVLRYDLGLMGTKIGCREGQCGACTVLLDGEAIYSCILPAMKAHNRSVVTIEGLGNITKPHVLQQAIADSGGVQCGYCTPGFVLSGAALLSETPNPPTYEILEAIEGNLCRCTGYKRIVNGIQLAAERMKTA